MAITRIKDLRNPELTAVQLAALERAESTSVEISEDAILSTAMLETGLSDFGPPDFRERLDVWLQEVGDDPEVTAYGRGEFFWGCVRYASTRLRIEET